MPLYTYRCPCGATADLLRKMSEADAPASCTCGQLMTRGIAPTAPIVVAGRHGPREGAAQASADSAFTTTHETSTLRVREKGRGFVDVTWGCPDCGARTSETYTDKPLNGPACTCGAITVEVYVPPPAFDWFKERCGSANGYFDAGLGEWITSREQRKALMDARGLVEFGEVGDVHDDWNRKQSERAANEDAEIRDMLRGVEHGPDAAKMKAARERGEVADWKWMVEAVHGLDGP